MSVSEDQISFSPLIIKYEGILEKNPQSQVFAPLADLYRKLGLMDKAVRLLKAGINHNPNCIAGHIGIASCYLDEGEVQTAYVTMKSLVGAHLDNIKLQKLFGKVCLALDYKDEAIQIYKHLLFLNPRDEEASCNVLALSTEIQDSFFQKQAILGPQENKFNLEKLEINFEEGEEWREVKLGNAASSFQCRKEEATESLWEFYQALKQRAEEVQKIA